MSNPLVAVLSDSHGNSFALHACLDDAQRRAKALGVGLQVWFLGDLVNGPPGSHESLYLFEELGDSLREWLLGNHDLAQLLWWPKSGAPHSPLTQENRATISSEALTFIRLEAWRDLLADDVAWLEPVRLSIPRVWQRWVLAPTLALSRDIEGVFLAHGLAADADMRSHLNTLRGLLDTPLSDHLRSTAQMLRTYSDERIRLLVTGHTHVPMAWREDKSGAWHPVTVGDENNVQIQISMNDDLAWYALDDHDFWVLNVGSVGHQKMRNAALANSGVYLLLKVDSDNQLHVSYRRVRYDLENALKEYERKGCPEWLRFQLQNGF